jgi:hypothetical protein
MAMEVKALPGSAENSRLPDITPCFLPDEE